jgi:16S rRNA G1207 methylase RsmC
MKWDELYPTFSKDGIMKHKVQFADIGCGYGGLLSILSHFANKKYGKLIFFFFQ